MALRKEKMTEYGVPIEYWKIQEVLIRPSEDYVFIRVAGYPNEKVRRSNVNPMEIQVVKSNVLLSPVEGNVINYLYKIIKQSEFFLDAEDLLENFCD